MRLPPLNPAGLSPELRHVHDEIAGLMARSQPSVVAVDGDGALVGPFPAMLHVPQCGLPALSFQRVVSVEARLPPRVREVAILTVGASFGARYALYAHEITAAELGMPLEQVAVIVAGGTPATLSDEEAIAHDVARVLAGGRVLPSATYARAIGLLGHDGVGELVFLIGGYCLIAILLNAFDVPVPDADAK